MKPRLSVLVPVYNVEDYLPRCLDSLLAQTYKNLDIVLVDDGSTDGSGRICDVYAAQHACMRVVHKKNGGLVSARQAGLRASDPTALYVTFADSDDWLDADAYMDMMRVQSTEPVDCVIAGHYEDVEKSSKPILPPFASGRYDRARMDQELFPYIMGREPFYTWGIFGSLCNKIFRKERLSAILLEEDEAIRIGEDAAIVYPFLYHARSVFILPACYYHYVQHPGSMVKTLADPERERTQMTALHRFLAPRLPQAQRRQYFSYMLFIMLPRADALYDGWHSLPYLFPFSDVPRGARIILYGAGTYGQRLYKVWRHYGMAEIAGWADRNAPALRKLGLPVDPPEAMQQMDAVDVVLALEIGSAREGAKKDLERRFPQKRIHVLDLALIFSKETLGAFRLLDN